MKSIPPEIVDLILSDLRPHFDSLTQTGLDLSKEKCTLLACTLVCKAWKPLATFHVFREVSYSFIHSDGLEKLRASQPSLQTGDPEQPPTQRWINVYRPPGWVRMPLKTLAHLKIFLDAHPEVRQSIRRLGLQGHNLDGSQHTEKINQAFFVDLVNMLPNLQELELLDVVTDSGASLPDPQYIHPLRLLRLEFRKHGKAGGNYTEHDAFHLLACFSSVDELHIGAPKSLGADVALGSREMRLRIRELYVGTGRDDRRNGNPDRLLQHLAQHPDTLASVRSLAVRSSHDWAPLGDVLKPCLRIARPNLEKIELDAPLNGSDLFLTSCTNLKVVGININLAYSFAQTCREVLDTLGPFFTYCGLSRATNPHFRTLCIRMRIEHFQGEHLLRMWEPAVSSAEARNAFHGVGVDVDALSENDARTLRENEMDGALVAVCERAGLRGVDVHLERVAWSSGVLAERIARAVFSKVAEKGLLRLEHS